MSNENVQEQEQEIENIQLELEQAKYLVERKEAFDRLLKNKDFIKLIEKGYFEEEASRLVLLKAEPVLLDDARSQKIIENGITSIGGLRQYLVKINQEGITAIAAIKEANLTIDEINSEDYEEVEE